MNGPRQGSLLELAKQNAQQTTSTGVGLANIRNRLMQAYGDNHQFRTSSGSGGGFIVTIDIPFETAEEEAAETAQESASAQLASPAQQSTTAPFAPGRPLESNA